MTAANSINSGRTPTVTVCVLSIELPSLKAHVLYLLGYIEPYELIAAAKEQGFEMSDDEAKEWIEELDGNHDGKVSFSGMLPLESPPVLELACLYSLSWTEFLTAFGELKSKQ